MDHWTEVLTVVVLLELALNCESDTMLQTHSSMLCLLAIHVYGRVFVVVGGRSVECVENSDPSRMRPV